MLINEINSSTDFRYQLEYIINKYVVVMILKCQRYLFFDKIKNGIIQVKYWPENAKVKT